MNEKIANKLLRQPQPIVDLLNNTLHICTCDPYCIQPDSKREDFNCCKILVENSIIENNIKNKECA